MNRDGHLPEAAREDVPDVDELMEVVRQRVDPGRFASYVVVVRYPGGRIAAYGPFVSSGGAQVFADGFAASEFEQHGRPGQVIGVPLIGV
ncbi:MAG: hypothetical protein QM733_04510 [Ilumatobacteraceae bacterium]